MSADVERIIFGLRYIHEIWANVIQVAIAAWLLEIQTGAAVTAPLVVAVVVCNPEIQDNHLLNYFTLVCLCHNQDRCTRGAQARRMVGQHPETYRYVCTQTLVYMQLSSCRRDIGNTLSHERCEDIWIDAKITRHHSRPPYI
jgi:hypothetical protein